MKQVRVHLISLAGLLFFGILAAGSVGGGGNKEQKSVEKFVEENKNVPLLHNVELLKHWEDVFNYTGKRYNDFEVWKFNTRNLVIDSKESNPRKAVYRPPFSDPTSEGGTLYSSRYMKPIPNYGVLKDYMLVFYLTDDGKVDKIEAEIVCVDEKSGEEKKHTIMGSEFDVEALAYKENITLQEEVVEGMKQAKAMKEEKEQQRKSQGKDFEKNCLSDWDGSCPALVDLIKENLGDPESFEHVETGYKIMGDYVLVQMKFRHRNALGGKVLNVVQAKVSSNCEVMELVQ